MIWWEIVVRLIVSAIVGGAIGFERERSHRPAGFRTHTLVCVGAALAMLINIFIADKYYGIYDIDPGRMGSYVISGIGFLGAGAIIKDGVRIQGLTTAASLWVVASIGLSFGAGFYLGGLTGSVLLFTTLVILKAVEKNLIKKTSNIEIILLMKNKTGTMALLLDTLHALKVEVRDMNMEYSVDDWQKIRLLLRLPKIITKEALVNELTLIKGIKLNTKGC